MPAAVVQLQIERWAAYSVVYRSCVRRNSGSGIAPWNYILVYMFLHGKGVLADVLLCQRLQVCRCQVCKQCAIAVEKRTYRSQRTGNQYIQHRKTRYSVADFQQWTEYRVRHHRSALYQGIQLLAVDEGKAGAFLADAYYRFIRVHNLPVQDKLCNQIGYQGTCRLRT